MPDDLVEALALEQFHQQVSARREDALREFQRQFRQIHRSRLIHGIYAGHVWGHIRQNKVHFRGAEARTDLREDLFFPEIPQDELDARYRIHRQNIGRDDSARVPEDTRRVLAPTAGRRAEIHAADAGAQQALARLNLLELENRARTPALALRAFDVFVARVLGKPSSTAFGAFWHRLPQGTPYTARMALSERQKKYLRRLAHPQSPIVMIGNAGLTDAVAAELERALATHELVKVSVRIGDRERRDEALAGLAGRTSSELVQRIGNVGVFYRRRAELPKIVIPDK